VPDGWTGNTYGIDAPSLRTSSDFRKILQDWKAKIPAINPDYIGGNVTGNVTGAGVQAICISTPYYVDLLAPENSNITIFSVNFTRFDDIARTPTLNMTVQFPSSVDGSCNATMNTVVCSIK
jgi:hypothetical protein